jgi:hypothetical protein
VVPPEQDMLEPEAVGVTALPDEVRVRVAVLVQPLESVTVTRYVPAESPVTEEVVPTTVVPFVQTYVYGDTPLVAFTDTDPLLPPQVGFVPVVLVVMFCAVTVKEVGALAAQPPLTASTLTLPVLVLVVTLTEGNVVTESDVDQLFGKYHS